MIAKLLKNRSRWLLISLGLVYVWFGTLKFIPGCSPAEDLASETIQAMTAGLLPAKTGLILLAIWEVLLGVCFLLDLQRKRTVQLAIIHLVFTFSVFLLFPGKTFTVVPVAFTIVGQYIMKNLVFIAALFYLYPEESSGDMPES